MPIVTPGRRIGSAYSSSQSTKKRMQRHRRSGYAALMLTSMVDMFTILVLYLIQQFNSTGQILFVDPNVRLPEARKVVNVVGNPPVITIDRENISLQGKPIEATSVLLKEASWDAPNLEKSLQDMRDLSTSVATATSGRLVTDGAKGLVMIQADLSIPYQLVKKVMFIASKVGFERVDFAVTRVGTAVATIPEKL